MRPHSLAVLGLGAIGGSVAWQARLAGVPSVIGYSPDRGDSVHALRAGALHDIADSAVRAVNGADLVVLAAPPRAILDLLGLIGPHLSPEALVTDVASVKAPLLAKARECGLEERYAGSHPFTGTHLAGWPGARPDRFRGAIVYVTSTGARGQRAAREVANFWEVVMGAHPVLIDAAVHDAQLAWTSHLPQAVASALSHLVGREPEIRGAAFGSGMRDTTRLAASPSNVWADVFLMNQRPVVQALGRLEEAVAELRRLIERGDRASLQSYLEEAAAFRHRLEGDDRSQESSESPGPG
ncbi:MAG TPA: prephenate dehydrogenase [Gemmatimonadales bacterium]|nr:prephenate dehydrogenase [Gemmatimonadales bacterium]